VNFGGVQTLQLLSPSGKTVYAPRPSRYPLRHAPSISQVATLPRQNGTRLSTEVEKAAWKIFNTIDANSDGQITKDEMVHAFRDDKTLWNEFKFKFWRDFKLKALNSYMQLVKESDTDGRVSFCEFSREFIKNADIDGDGTVSFEEFRTFLSQSDEGGDLAKSSSDSTGSITLDDDSLYEMLYLFENIDLDKDGQVTKKELNTATQKSSVFRETMNLKSMGDVTSLVEDADTDGDGVVSFDEFKSYLVSSHSKEFLEYLDCGHDQQYAPRKTHAWVVILREIDEELQVLVRLQSSRADKPQRLSLLGGRKEELDEDSRMTALRKIAESTGLVDIAGLDGSPDWLRGFVESGGLDSAPEWLLKSMRLSNISLPTSPPSFLMFDKGATRDFWVLKLNGPGVFLKGQESDIKGLDDMNSIADSLPRGTEITQCFGHAWIPVKSLKTVPDTISKIGGNEFNLKVFRAVVALRRHKQRLENTASVWQQLDSILFG